MAEAYYRYGKDIVVSQDSIDAITEGFVEIIKKELPREALCTKVVDSMLTEIKDTIHEKMLLL